LGKIGKPEEKVSTARKRKDLGKSKTRSAKKKKGFRRKNRLKKDH